MSDILALNFQAHCERLQDYVATMKPGVPMTAGQGVLYQRKLWNCIQLTLRQENSEFIRHYAELLRVVKENRHRQGVFNERYVYRFFSELNLGAEELSNFRRLVNLLLCTCDIGSRHLALRQIDMRTTLAGIVDEQQRQRIASFYEP